jgi:hypothetical protein
MRPTARLVDASEVLSRAISHYNFRKPCESQYRAQAGGGHKHKAGFIARLSRLNARHRLRNTFPIFYICYWAASVHSEQMESRAICCLIEPGFSLKTPAIEFFDAGRLRQLFDAEGRLPQLVENALGHIIHDPCIEKDVRLRQAQTC